MTAPVVAEPLGAVDIEGSCDICMSLAAGLAVLTGAFEAPAPPHAAKAMAAAAVRMIGRNFTCRVSCAGHPSVHAITDRPLEAAWGHQVIDRRSGHAEPRITDPGEGS
jgi:hypothetical protein